MKNKNCEKHKETVEKEIIANENNEIYQILKKYILKDIENKQSTVCSLTYVNGARLINKAVGFQKTLGREPDENIFEYCKEIEDIGCLSASKYSKTPDDIKACLDSLDEYEGKQIDTEDLMTELKIKLYGFKGYLKQEMNTQAYENFVEFTKRENIPNPMEVFEPLKSDELDENNNNTKSIGTVAN